MANEIIESTPWFESDVVGTCHPTGAEEVKAEILQAQSWGEVEEALNYHAGSFEITTSGWDVPSVKNSYSNLWSEYVQASQNPRTPS
jgi:hypothetical protein